MGSVETLRPAEEAYLAACYPQSTLPEHEAISRGRRRGHLPSLDYFDFRVDLPEPPDEP